MTRIRCQISLLCVVVLAGCGASGREQALQADNERLARAVTKVEGRLAVIEADMTALRKDVTQLLAAKAQQAAAGGVGAKVQLTRIHPTNLSDAGEVLRERLGVEKKDQGFVVNPGYVVRLSRDELDIRQLQKLVDTLVRTCVLLPPDAIELKK